jgi:hypothetical protein
VYILGSLYLAEDSSTYTPEMEIIQIYAALVVLLSSLQRLGGICVY